MKVFFLKAHRGLRDYSYLKRTSSLSTESSTKAIRDEWGTNLQSQPSTFSVTIVWNLTL